MNGLKGRMLRLPSQNRSSSEILVVYGHHAMLERWWGLAQSLQQYGNVTMPDLPGFGGMDSFNDIGTKPTIDAYADYLASFIKLRYRRKKLSIIGISFGFVIVTRMFQRYPDLLKQVKLVVSAAGFAHHDDFRFSRVRMFNYRMAAKPLSYRVPAFMFRHASLNPPVLRFAYGKTYNAKHKFAEVLGSADAYKAMMDFEVKLWQINDVRTHWATVYEFLHLDNCNDHVPTMLFHMYSEDDNYFNNHIVEQHLRVIFEDVQMVKTTSSKHIPSVLANKQDFDLYLPEAIKNALSH